MKFERKDKRNSISYRKCNLTGETGALIRNISNRWLIGIRESEPAILDMFRERDILPYRELLPWSGEFAGKYLTGAAYVYRVNPDPALADYIKGFIKELLTLQDNDGYLGCFSNKCHLTGTYSQNPDVFIRGIGGPNANEPTWDSWAHYHMMYGLLLWYDLLGEKAYFNAVEKIADLFINTFYEGKKTILSIGSTEMNLAVYHIFALLYRRTGDTKYYHFALNVEKDIESKGAGEYIKYTLNGYPFYQCPKPRWESMHSIMGIAEMYRSTGEARYLEAVCSIVYSILETDVHNTGAFSTDEQAIGNPFQSGKIETCCVIAYNALVIELLKITGDLRLVDFLERSHYNAVLGYNSPSGYWSTYDTPMIGYKKANFHDIGFQCRPGSPRLNCCSVNAPRGTAALADWIIMQKKNTLYLNYYEDMVLETEDGISVTVSGGYPANHQIQVTVDTAGQNQTLAFRIPAWSRRTEITLDEETCYPEAGTYWTIPVSGKITVTIRFDFTPYTEAGGGELTGKSSLYIGPVLYGFDSADNPGIHFDAIPAIAKQNLKSAHPTLCKDGSIRLTLSEGLILKDFYHLGTSGSIYTSWLPISM